MGDVSNASQTSMQPFVKRIFLRHLPADMDSSDLYNKLVDDYYTSKIDELDQPFFDRAKNAIERMETYHHEGKRHKTLENKTVKHLGELYLLVQTKLN